MYSFLYKHSQFRVAKYDGMYDYLKDGGRYFVFTWKVNQAYRTKVETSCIRLPFKNIYNKNQSNITTTDHEARTFSAFCLQQMVRKLAVGDHEIITYQMISIQQIQMFSKFLNSLEIENVQELKQAIRFPVDVLRRTTINRNERVDDAEQFADDDYLVLD